VTARHPAGRVSSGHVSAEHLLSWNDTLTRAALVEFVETAAQGIPADERVAVFDNDGTLWCEKPMPIELGFILERLAAMAEQDASLQSRQPWQAAYEKDYAWLGDVVTKHYHGDDSDVKVLIGGLLQAFAGWTVEEYATAATSFLEERTHPTLGRRFRECGYVPMVELLRYLEAHGFTCYIASGGDRDFMRPITQDIYGLAPERIVGSSTALKWVEGGNGGTLSYLGEMDVFDDGPVKPVRIWSRVGRRPILAVGNSNGDIPMLHFASHSSRPSLSMLVRHDDGEREFAYDAGAEESLKRAAAEGWTVVSVKDDWATVFADTTT
jgi:phosphoserine phosphatase